MIYREGGREERKGVIYREGGREERKGVIYREGEERGIRGEGEGGDVHSFLSDKDKHLRSLYCICRGMWSQQ